MVPAFNWSWSGLLDALYHVFQDLVIWLFKLPATVFGWIIDTLKNQLPSGVVQHLGPLWNVASYINHWAPLGEALTLFGLYLAGAGVIFTYRTVKSWIPTLSGS